MRHSRHESVETIKGRIAVEVNTAMFQGLRATGSRVAGGIPANVMTVNMSIKIPTAANPIA